MGTLGEIYSRVYGTVCGQHPEVRPWHFQWLAGKDLYGDLRRVLPTCGGRIVDVGCGDKPYQRWLRRELVVEYQGLDVHEDEGVDVVIDPLKPWPLMDEAYDVVLCTQVLEHAREWRSMLDEAKRILKPGGRLVVSLPFIYNAHGAPEDYRRLSVDGLVAELDGAFDTVEIKKQGGIGSTLGLLLLNWVECSANLTVVGRISKGLLLPVWLAVTGIINAVGWLMDKVDHTGCFYSNVMFVGTKR